MPQAGRQGIAKTPETIANKDRTILADGLFDLQSSARRNGGVPRPGAGAPWARPRPLRRSSEAGNTWVGYFRQDGDASNNAATNTFTQWRAGWDASYGTDVRISPSLQIASGGFAGGSVMEEAGAPWFVGAGLGRTNLQPYWNLNFDPNDAWTLSAGHRSADNRLLQILGVGDNRQNPDQRHLHFLYRQPLADGERLTVDALYKTGLVDGERIRRWGVSLAWDWPLWSIRMAWDPKVNFSPVDALRLSVSRRF